jgi:hypothetical protein
MLEARVPVIERDKQRDGNADGMHPRVREAANPVIAEDIDKAGSRCERPHNQAYTEQPERGRAQNSFDVA